MNLVQHTWSVQGNIEGWIQVRVANVLYDYFIMTQNNFDYILFNNNNNILLLYIKQYLSLRIYKNKKHIALIFTQFFFVFRIDM